MMLPESIMLRRRVLQPELMDDVALPADAALEALRGLARLNRLSRNASLVWSAMRPTIMNLAGSQRRRLRLLDIATGSGDIPLQVAACAAKAGYSLEVTVCDIQRRMLDAAVARAKVMRLRVQALQLNACTDAIPAGFDVLTCSLFLHHLSAEDVVTLVRNMLASSPGVIVISDLCRSTATMAMVKAASMVVTRSRVVHVDAMLSVRAAWTVNELRTLLEVAGVEGFSIRPAFPARFVAVWNADRAHGGGR